VPIAKLLSKNRLGIDFISIADWKNQFLPGKWDTLGAKEEFNYLNLTPVVAGTQKRNSMIGT
jgi:hypothetical protein